MLEKRRGRKKWREGARNHYKTDDFEPHSSHFIIELLCGIFFKLVPTNEEREREGQIVFGISREWASRQMVAAGFNFAYVW